MTYWCYDVLIKLLNIHTFFFFVQQRERKRRNSDRSEDGYHSDGDYPEQDYRREPGEEKKSKTIMLWGLSPHVSEDDVSLVCFLFCFSAVFQPLLSLVVCVCTSSVR